MDFVKTIKINLAIWCVVVLNSIYMMYSNFSVTETALIQKGNLFSQILLGQALVLFLVLIGVERLFFRKSRINKFALESPKRISIPLYIITILGLSFGQASVIWGAAAFNVTGNKSILFVFYGVAILFMAYSFPWKCRVTTTGN